MRALIALLFMIWGYVALGQGGMIRLDSAKMASLRIFAPPEKQKEFIDTIKVRALVSLDFSWPENYEDGDIHEPVFATILRQIRKHYYPYHPDYIVMDEVLTVETIGYLGENGYPLSKILRIWITKPIK